MVKNKHKNISDQNYDPKSKRIRDDYQSRTENTGTFYLSILKKLEKPRRKTNRKNKIKCQKHIV